MKKVSLLLFLATNVAFAQKTFKVEIKGSGSPVLLFPGFACPGVMWEETVAQVSQTHQCHVFTFAGFGGLTPIDTPWFSSIKDELVSYIKERDLKGSILIGHSLGGTLALWLAAEDSPLFKKVIAVDALPAAIALMNPNYQKGQIIPYDNPQAKAQLTMSTEAFEKMSAQMASYMTKVPEKQALIAEWMQQADRQTYVYSYIDYLNTDLRDDLAKISVPVVVLGATFPSRAAVEPNFIKQYENLKGVTFEFIENAGHFMMYDQPQAYMEKIKAHVR